MIDVEPPAEWEGTVPDPGYDDLAERILRGELETPSVTEITLPEGQAAPTPADTHTYGDPFPVRLVSDALADPPQRPPGLVTGLIRRGELTVIGAPRAIGKSWFGMNLAALGSRGAGLLAGQMPIERPFRTLYCQGELDEWESWSRWQKIAGSGESPQLVAETFHRWRLKVTKQRVTQSIDGVTTTNEYLDSILDPGLEATVVAHDIDLLIIDPWAVYYGGNENSNDEAEAALGRLRHLSMKYGLAVIIFHHVTNKTERADREPEDMWRGATRLADWASTRVTILPHYTQKEAEAQQMTRRQARRYADILFLRRGEHTIDDFSMVMNWETGWWERWCPPGKERHPHSLANIAEQCRADGGWESVTRAARALNVGDYKARELLDAGVEMGFLDETTGERGARRFTFRDRSEEEISDPHRPQ